MKQEQSKEQKKQLERNREKHIRAIVPIHSKIPTEEYYRNYDRTFKKSK